MRLQLHIVHTYESHHTNLMKATAPIFQKRPLFILFYLFFKDEIFIFFYFVMLDFIKAVDIFELNLVIVFLFYC